jgi:hypothetical protein
MPCVTTTLKLPISPENEANQAAQVVSGPGLNTVGDLDLETCLSGSKNQERRRMRPKYESEEKNRENLRRTKARERRGDTEKDRSEGSVGQEKTRTELYREAQSGGTAPKHSRPFEDEQEGT